MKKLFFAKMSGAGNDFVVFDKGLNPDVVLSGSDIKQICDRRNGIGADGVITIDDSGNYDFLSTFPIRPITFAEDFEKTDCIFERCSRFTYSPTCPS